MITNEFVDQYKVNAGFWVARCPQNASAPRDLITKADQALYRSKMAGKKPNHLSSIKIEGKRVDHGEQKHG